MLGICSVAVDVSMLRASEPSHLSSGCRNCKNASDSPAWDHSEVMMLSGGAD